MNIIELKNAILRDIKYFISTLGDLIKLYPGNIDPIFRNLKPKPLGFLRVYLIIIAIPLFLGYYFHFAHYQTNPYSTENSLKLAFIYYLIAISLPMIISYILYLFDVRLVKRRVSYPETLTLFAYAFSFGLLCGIFRTFNETWVLHILTIMYSIYLIYAALGARFGYERIILPFIFLMLSGGVATMILFRLLVFFLGVPSEYWRFTFF